MAVEFVHPVIVGKRALPAIALTDEGGRSPRRPSCSAEPEDIAIAFGADDADAAETRGARRGARARLPHDRVLATAGARGS